MARFGAVYVFIVDNECIQYDKPCFVSAVVEANGEETLTTPLTQSMEGVPMLFICHT